MKEWEMKWKKWEFKWNNEILNKRMWSKMKHEKLNERYKGMRFEMKYENWNGTKNWSEGVRIEKEERKIK